MTPEQVDPGSVTLRGYAGRPAGQTYPRRSPQRSNASTPARSSESETRILMPNCHRITELAEDPQDLSACCARRCTIPRSLGGTPFSDAAATCAATSWLRSALPPPQSARTPGQRVSAPGCVRVERSERSTCEARCAHRPRRVVVRRHPDLGSIPSSSACSWSRTSNRHAPARE